MSDKKRSVCEKKNFDSIFNENFEAARNFLYYKCGDLQLAEDLAQDAFIKLWNHCKKVIFETAKQYVFKICNNAFLNELAHQKVVLRHQSTMHDHTNQESPEFILEEEEFKVKLEHAINQLSEKEREVFLLSRIDKKSYKEIAEIANVTVKAVERRMSLAFIKLRELLGGHIKI
ncbi:sigma-70 family RNA polymerase sigma factor [Reichenbachiella sp.]|uniref:RNA polymerase sigma factor n=1 Tax=Reichenbachiella sp. TaxID=2184521 RepID=UPI0032968E40